MTIQKWAWLIGMTDATDQRLLDWAKSYAKPPALELEGARLEADSYAPERRAIRLVVEADRVTINVRPSVPCVNPVLELVGAPSGDITVHLGDRLLDAKEYAWDGKTLWLNATLVQGTQVRLDFAQPVLEWLDEE